jgi:predicted AAA+ superfamily ATPase
MNYLHRYLEPLLLNALKHFPSIYLAGPRQAGKSTLIQQLTKKLEAHYLTFDNPNILASAQHDPFSFLKQFSGIIILDEAQLFPELFRHIKHIIDENRFHKKSQRFGQFILSGSANIMAVPKLAEALVGRVQLLTLLPLSVGEAYELKATDFLSIVFSNEKILFQELNHSISLEQAIQKSTFPELVIEKNIPHQTWFANYTNTLLQRDIRQLAQIEKFSALPLLLKLFATHVGGLLNDAELARNAGLNSMTFRRYRTLLEEVFLIKLIPPWFKNLGKRLVKAPKIYFTDTELLRYFLPQQNLNQLKKNQSRLYGGIIENFVASELLKKISITPEIQLYHFRTHDQKEIDFILENNHGEIVAIEVKASTTVTTHDFNHLEFLQAELGNSFIRGIVLYTGNQILSFGEKLIAMPLSSLWALN